jgi:hypothetical protein
LAGLAAETSPIEEAPEGLQVDFQDVAMPSPELVPALPRSRHRENIAAGCTHALGWLPQQAIAA